MNSSVYLCRYVYFRVLNTYLLLFFFCFLFADCKNSYQLYDGNPENNCKCNESQSLPTANPGELRNIFLLSRLILISFAIKKNPFFFIRLTPYL